MNYCGCCGEYTHVTLYRHPKANTSYYLCDRCKDALQTILGAAEEAGGEIKPQRLMAAVKAWYRHAPKEA